jgi:AmmeMemoRadiSam system protein B
MEPLELKIRKPKCAGRWYPYEKQVHRFKDNPLSSAVISPHAGFMYSGMVSLEAVSSVKKNRVWILGTSHYEDITSGIAIYYGNYLTSIGKAIFPKDLSKKDFEIIKKYLSDEGHRTEEHSVENVLYCLNHFKEEVNAFCCLVRIKSYKDFENISADIASVWGKDDSIIVSTDWNHFVSTDIIDGLMKESAGYLEKGDILSLYRKCSEGSIEACGIDGLYLAYNILTRTDQKTSFKILTSTNSSKPEFGIGGLISGTCVGYISARN